MSELKELKINPHRDFYNVRKVSMKLIISFIVHLSPIVELKVVSKGFPVGYLSRH